MNDVVSDDCVPLKSSLGGQGRIFWLTGFSGAGKTTLALRVAEELRGRGFVPYVLDGDFIRKGLCSDLGFSESDRSENIRRIGEVARLFLDAGLIVIVACISPIKKDRDRVRGLVSAGRFVEVFLDCPLEVCERRDPKGLYRKARREELSDFTGITSLYERPTAPEVHLYTGENGVEACVLEVMKCVEGW